MNEASRGDRSLSRTAGRVRAPELVGRGGWVGTERPLRLADLRGRFVLLDFWTSGCVNCLHVLEELRPLEADHADVLTVVGVHSPKFRHEGDHDAVVAAVARLGVEHPVLDDPDMATWQAYAVRAWPTLVLVDPEGYVVAQYSGEGHAHALRALLAKLVPEHEARGTLVRARLTGPPPPRPGGTLRFPGKALPLPGGTVLVSDAGQHRLVELAADLETVVRVIGSGERGRADGGPDRAGFEDPQGLCLLPQQVRTRVGYDVLVADTVSHLLRAVRLADGAVHTVAGTGAPWRPGDPVGGVSGTVAATPLSSPWDLVWSERLRAVVVAMAGVHQLWSFDPVDGALALLAGTAHEGVRDGGLADAWFAQTSGVTTATDGTVWIVDPETSALRRVDLEPADQGTHPRAGQGEVSTVVGTGLFDFGLRDGPAEQALLQHPAGVASLPDGSVLVADTYNRALRRFDPGSGALSTVATGLAEPTDVVLDTDGRSVLVVESAAHRLLRLPVDAAAVAAAEFEDAPQRPSTPLAAGAVDLVVGFAPPPGQKLDERWGPATRLMVSSTPEALIRSGAGRGTGLHRVIEVDPSVGSGVLHVAASAASCDEDTAGGACHLHQQDWGVPVEVVDGAAPELRLVLGGT